MAVWRFQVTPRLGPDDPRGRQVAGTLADFGLSSVRSVLPSRLFLVELTGPSAEQSALAARIAEELLTDPVVETCTLTPQGQTPPEPDDALPIEVFLKPGVTDNVAVSTALALADMGIHVAGVRTGRRYELRPIPIDRDLPTIARLLGNACIEDVIIGTRAIAPSPKPIDQPFKLCRIPIRDLDESGLKTLSRTGHLFLSLIEMAAIRDHFHQLGRDPTDLELETLAQTWSEHCVHKTLKSAVTYHGAPFPTTPQEDHGTTKTSKITVRYDNLLEDTIVQATQELTRTHRGPTCLSVFADNAGIIAFDDQYGIAFKVETHNHPSAIEPYGGAATGLGGVIRDILGCGLGAKPIAGTDCFCVAPPDWPIDRLPTGTIHPRTVLKGIVAGVRDYANRMGIPTVNGAVHFDPRYLANPLVHCGCVGLIPRNRIDKQPRPGDHIVLVGGRTGRDGIHGATFSSAALTANHADEFAHAVQIGNPIEEKKVLDLILLARDFSKSRELQEPTLARQETSRGLQPARPHKRLVLSPNALSTAPTRCLFSAITDCGAGGLSSAVGEMAQHTGAEVSLDRVPLKYPGLRYDEIWISEAQERMVLAVQPENLETLLALAHGEDVEATTIGRFTDTGRLVVKYNDTVVGDLDMAFLHDGLPKGEKTAEWTLTPPSRQSASPSPSDPIDELKRRLGDPNTASKHWIIRQYDHEVQAGSVVKPLVGPHDGPSDAAVVRPRLDSDRGIALSCGMSPIDAENDPYFNAVAAIDEAMRNVVCVGGDPEQTAILDNFCWPDADEPRSMGALVRMCQACHDAAVAYGVPFISGKDSLNNTFTLSGAEADMLRLTIEQYDPGLARQFNEGRQRGPDRMSIPYSLLISAVAIVPNVNRCITSAPRWINGQARLFLVGQRAGRWAEVQLNHLATLHQQVATLIRKGDILAAHDCSEGGIAVAVAEMAIASGLQTEFLVDDPDDLSSLILRRPSCYVVEPTEAEKLARFNQHPGLFCREVARMHPAQDAPMFHLVHAFSGEDRQTDARSRCTALSELRAAWRNTLDW